MVKMGLFSLQLLNAETNVPFPEHRGPDNGNDYVEVEPNAEYWIRVQSDRQEDSVICDFTVDGMNLGFYESLGYPYAASSDVGIWSKVDGQHMQQAFKVKKVQRATTGHGDEFFWIGKVQVDFYEASEVEVFSDDDDDEQPDFVNQWNGGQTIGEGDSKAKAVASQIGTTSKVTDADNVRFEPGDLIQSITLHYCTAVGLIHAGVLPQPEFWEYHRKRMMMDNHNNDMAATTLSSAAAIMEPQVIKLQTRNLAGDLMQEKTYEMFDLTQLVDDDDDDAMPRTVESDIDNDS
jgi:hypothetical protein